MSANNSEEKYDASKKKMAFVERDLYLKPLLRLKQQEDILEKGLIAAIENIKLDSNLWREVVHEYKEITMKRQNLFNAMYKNMENISTEMESVKHIARHPEEIQNLDINTYKLKLIKLSQKMQDLKKSCCIEPLMQEQAVLEAELREFQPSIQKYENLQKNVTSSGSNKMETKKETQDYKDVHDFHALVALTGHTGNWSMEDHLFFLKMRKKCENVPALVAAIQKKYPDLSVESIVNHESWYKQYENLREKQRAAVTEWRKRKEREKMRNIEQLEKSMNLRESEDVSNEMDKRKRMIVSRKVKSCPVETKRTNESAGSNTAEKKELIRKWRMEKESKRSMDEEQLRMQAKLKREIEGNKRQKRREKIQEALEEYRRKKSFEGASKELNERWKEKYKFDATLIKEFRKQDEEYTKKRRDLIERSKKPSKSETIGIKKMELVDARTYSTFLESTKVWREKCKATSWTNHSDDTRYIKDIPRICIRWRNEESEDLNI
uniref:coiled-coil domain-containing protein 112-like n=1 Tax=Osmia lignaria TaxID=473952 RepID=UPI0014787A94|nr:coiled-coil domain-containing protein 112-like [Osmia lignaria]